MSALPVPNEVTIVEVGPRDGLQNEIAILSVEQRAKLIRELAGSGLLYIEAGSFIAPKWVPQMANTAAVYAQLDLEQNVVYPALVPNLRGMQDAIAAGVKEIAVFAAATETFSQKNINCSIAQSMSRFAELINLAQANDITVRAYLSCVLGCPYEGKVNPRVVVDLAESLVQLGCYQVALGDTIGVGTPNKVRSLLSQVSSAIGVERIAVHFHDTYGQALANILSSLDLGVATVDSSVAGLGGCPYANGASGNVATEDVVYMLDGMGITTGVNLAKLVGIGRNICTILNTPMRSKVNLAVN